MNKGRKEETKQLFASYSRLDQVSVTHIYGGL